MSRQYLVLGAVSVVSMAAGAASGFFVAKHILEERYVKVAEQEIEDAKLYYSRLHKKGDFSDPTALAERADELSDRIASETISKVLKYVPDVENDVTYVVEEDQIDLETDEMIADSEIVREIEVAVAHGHPYLISKEEYMANDTNYAQSTITYFEEDDVLVDENDVVIEYSDDVVGIHTTSRFGVMSGDNNIVYVRSDRKEIEFEIVRNKGNYARDVLGFVEHSDNTRVRKFRREYE